MSGEFWMWGSILIALRLSENMFAKDKLDQSDMTP